MIDFADPNVQRVKEHLYKGLKAAIASLKPEDVQVRQIDISRESITADELVSASVLKHSQKCLYDPYHQVEISFGAQPAPVMRDICNGLKLASAYFSRPTTDKIIIQCDMETLANRTQWHIFDDVCERIVPLSLQHVERSKDISAEAKQVAAKIFTGVKHLLPKVRPTDIYFSHENGDDLTDIHIDCGPDLTLTQKSKLTSAFKAADDPRQTNFGYTVSDNSFVFGGSMQKLAALDWKKFQAEAQKIKPEKTAGMGGV